MAEYEMDPLEPVVVEINADTPSIFRFIAQKRMPGRDYREFVSSKDWGQEPLSRYWFELLPPVRSYTDLRIYFLMDGAANHPTRIKVALSQHGKPLGDPIVCEGKIGSDGGLVFETAEATLIGADPVLK